MRRFVSSVLIGVGVVAVPYLWVLCDLWTHSPSLLRTAWSNGYASNFYDLQARAMFHGHLYVANGALASEAFLHDGRQYTYFGLFPSLLRMPVLLVTSRLDGKLSALSILLAWCITALFLSLLVWRIRVVIRGSAVLGRAEAASYGVVVATVMGGSVLMALASSPWVFSEDVAWSVALTIGTLFALLGVLERPSWRRVVASSGLILAANLTRSSTGYACVIGAVLVALWFVVDPRGVTNRRWAAPVLFAGLIPLAVSCAVNEAKFGILFGLAASDQLAYRQFDLHGSYFGLHFLPSTLLAYFGPTGLRFRSVFPFITFPSAPAHPVGNIRLYGNDWVASIPTAMPLLFLLALWGTLTTFRSRGETSSSKIRIVLVTAAVAGGTVMVYGWIANRFVGDLIPVLALAAVIGTVGLWGRLSPDQVRRRWLALIIITVLGLFGIAANSGVAASFQGNWSNQQVANLVKFQNTISNATGHPLQHDVIHGMTLPIQAPAGQLFVGGECEGLYMATGFATNSTVTKKDPLLLQAFALSFGWVLVQRGAAISRSVVISSRFPLSSHGPPVLVATIGGTHQSILSVRPSGPGSVKFTLSGPSATSTSAEMPISAGATTKFSVVLDTFLRSFKVSSRDGQMFQGYLLSSGPVVMAAPHRGTTTDPLSVSVSRARSLPKESLCQRLR